MKINNMNSFITNDMRLAYEQYINNHVYNVRRSGNYICELLKHNSNVFDIFTQYVGFYNDIEHPDIDIDIDATAHNDLIIHKFDHGKRTIGLDGYVYSNDGDSLHHKIIRNMNFYLTKSENLNKELFNSCIAVHYLKIFIDNLPNHDASKTQLEFNPYCLYFYGDGSEYTDAQNEMISNQFDKAWLDHIHKNPHHWQHWILTEDDNKGPKPLIIDPDWILEMLSDWFAMSFRETNDFKSASLSLIRWYVDHINDIFMHPISKWFIESIILSIYESTHEDYFADIKCINNLAEYIKVGNVHDDGVEGQYFYQLSTIATMEDK